MFYGRFPQKNGTNPLAYGIIKFSMTVVAVLSAIYIILVFYSSFGNNWKTEFIAYNDVNKYIDTPPCNYSSVIMEDTDVFRIAQEKRSGNHNRPENMAMLNGYYGMTYFLSIINENTQEYVNNSLGEKLNWRSWGVGDDNILNSDCGVKYYMSLSPKAPDDYRQVDEVVFLNDTWYIYRNTLFRGMAYISNVQNQAKKGGGILPMLLI